MRVQARGRFRLLLVCGLLLQALGQAGAQSKKEAPMPPLQHPVLWRQPARVADLDVFYGPGGKEGSPTPPYTFEAEDRSSKTPKFTVRDGAGRTWVVELGANIKPEIAASRLLWAAGYLADDDYLVRKASVTGLRLRSGKRYLHNSDLYDARFTRRVDGQTKLGVWHWRKNVFSSTKELNGLRVMMALLNCWDLRDENNPVIKDPRGYEQFRVSGLAASFGKTGPRLFRGKPKVDAQAFARSGFITRKAGGTVDFATPARSYNPFSMFSRKSSTVWVGRGVPRDDARWMGSLLGQLSHKQVEDAFWAAGYTVGEVNQFADVVQGRIRALSDL